MPAPTTCSDMLPSVNICYAVALFIIPKDDYFYSGLQPVFKSHIFVKPSFHFAATYGEFV